MESNQLTEEEFKLILLCMDSALREPFESLGSMLFEAMLPDDVKRGATYEAFKSSERKKQEHAKREREIRDESIKILQGKILLLKRQTSENSALDEAHTILNK